ncbi:unnamed protein product [Orchesella dallaii]|uniref:Peptidase S1 domain-containing protein n=1 Tax=Orchesella dallaii TaxID=48710 RepID=A0ABP1QZJ5_9HEXA
MFISSSSVADVECGKAIYHPYVISGNGRPAFLSHPTPLSLQLLRHHDDRYWTAVSQQYYSSSDTNSVAISESNTRKARIINGENAVFGEAPWVVSIKFRTSNNHFCGGTIINMRYVLSASHCFGGVLRGLFSVNMIKATVGEYNESAEEWPVEAVDVGIESIIFHHDFKLRDYVNDIALLRLERDLEWGLLVFGQPICLSDSNEIVDDDEKETERMKATVYGWGQAVDFHDGINYYPEVLQKVSVPILSNTECAKWFRRQNSKWSPGDGHLCAGYKRGMKDSCQGDSGSPLVLYRIGRRQPAVVGIVIAGSGCGKPGYPGIYTNVPAYIDWIKSKISD